MRLNSKPGNLPISESKPFSNPTLHLYILILTSGYVWNVGIVLRVAELIIFISLVVLVSRRRRLLLPREFVFFCIFLMVISLVGYVLNMNQLSLRFLFEIAGIVIYGIYAYALLTSFYSFGQVQSIVIRSAIIITATIWVDFTIASIYGPSTSQALADSLLLAHHLAMEGDRYRPSGILYEPSEVALYLPFATVVAILGRRYLTGLWLLSGILIPSSSLAIVVLTILFILIMAANFSPKKLAIFLAPLLGVVLIVSVTKIGDSLDRRFTGAVGAFSSHGTSAEYDPEELRQAGGTVSGVYTSYLVAIEGLSHSPVFGLGIGSFLQLYPFYLPKVLPGAEGITRAVSGEKDYSLFIANGGLFLRMLFEIGIVGSGLVLYFIFKPFFRTFKCDRSGEAAMAMLFVVAYFVACFIRKNVVLHWETWFCVMLIIFVFRQLRRQKKSSHISSSRQDPLYQPLRLQ